MDLNWTIWQFKTTPFATKTTDRGIKPCGWGFRWKKGSPSFPSYYLHTVRDYTEARHRDTSSTKLFFYLKHPTPNPPKLFHYLLHIKVDLRRKPGFRRVNAVERRFLHPAQATPTYEPLQPRHPACCFNIQAGCSPPLFIPTLLKTLSIWCRTLFPTYNSIPCHHNLSISLARPPPPSGVKGSGDGDGICLSIDSAAVLLSGWPLSRWMAKAFLKTVTHCFSSQGFSV